MALVAVLLSACILLLLWRFVRSKSPSIDAHATKSDKQQTPSETYQEVEPVHTCFPQCVPPLRIRPFKPKFHLTMALENMPLSELVVMDATYQERIELRRRLMSEHSSATLACKPVAEAAVLELYDWLINLYLPRRFPTVYAPQSATQLRDQKSAQPCILNAVTNEPIPSRPSAPSTAFRTLGANIDTDFLVLLPSSEAADGSPIYHLEAFVTCFPSGFSTREKCGKPLAEIHGPVPGYAAKLERSMDRFFAKLECGRAVKRHNWAVTTNEKLFVEAGNHLYKDNRHTTDNEKTLDVHSPDLESDIERQRQDVVIEHCRLRCERQTLHRLPKTRALVFAFKTYQYKLADIKAEGECLALADAIEGLAAGSVPDMNFYKRGVVWGDKVIEYLRS